MLFKKRTGNLSAEKLLEVELDVKSRLFEPYGWPISKEVVQERMNLYIQASSLSPDIEAILRPSYFEEKNGIILINELYEDDGEFEYMHEVIHYVMDIGIGKKVDREFRRKHSENSLDDHERGIDARAAAVLIPVFLLLHDIEEYRRNILVIDEVAFMKKLRKKYSCSQACLERRLIEVHTLRKNKKCLNELRLKYAENRSILEELM